MHLWIVFSAVLMMGCMEEEVALRTIYIDYTCTGYEDIIEASAEKLNMALGYSALDILGFRGAYLPNLNDGLNNIVCLDSSDYDYFQHRSPNVPGYANVEDIVLALDRMHTRGVLTQVVMHEFGHFVSGCGHIQDGNGVHVMSIGIKPDQPVTEYTEADIELIDSAIQKNSDMY